MNNQIQQNEITANTQYFATTPIRQVSVDGTELWALVDICAALGLSHSCSARIPATNKRSCRIATNGGPQQLTFVDLEGFELAVIRSNKPLANTMRSWIHEHKPHTTKETTMNTDITTHNFHGSGVRIHTDGDTIEYCARDIATALGYKDTINAIKQHCRGVVNRHPIVDTLGRPQEAAFIGEGDVYRLIVSSQLPAATEFEHWLFDEVLPSIRKHGGYMAGQETMSPEQMLAASMRWLESRIAEQQGQINAQQAQLDAQAPKVLFADAVSTSKRCILVGELAKILRQNGVDMGEKRLFAWLREHGYLMKRNGIPNYPTQRSMDLKLFEIKETPIVHSDGHTTLSITTKVTPKGQQYFIQKFLAGKCHE